MYDVTRSIPMIPDKKLIKLRFEQAAATYEQQATVQHRVADRLLGLLNDSAPGVTPEQILEIGCCTGLLTEKVLERYPSIQQLTVSDLVAAFEQCVCRKAGLRVDNITFLAGDIETIRLPARYDLIISSSTLHWVHDLPALCAKLHRHLQPQGTLAFSLYGKDNLAEIRAVTGVGLAYRNLDQLRTVVAERFDILAAEETRETLWYPDPIAVLQHLRATGVNSIGQRPWTRRQVNAFSHAYRDRFSGQQGVRLTYHPMFIVARPRYQAEGRIG
ncbi:biotin biosynthesis protein BioC [Desulfobulbus propionicus DSM 2032]|uniref:Malonyl-[acyl-carrier protein] O-methyltransferase n=1 Tax=Desulfobulbus propionicus (strain ATCC 33891 / DSM 2032 / VKM B-1956 / 1pr3) TaxID=577650 RepID=A0A7U3YIT8_DESPD|nr:malonyl-ACP O-methyltransferase BioC [Desulfobulbus propionicus]ADW16200.1 biotin biosynthesis protein BioC [Desulfobulbus propionicus DSM 2032]